MYSLNSKFNTNHQSPKCLSGKSRPGTSLGFSLIDMNENFINLKGVQVPKTYLKSKETFDNLYIKEKSIERKKPIKRSNSKQIAVNTNYFKTYQARYNELLRESQSDFKNVVLLKKYIKEKSEKKNFNQNNYSEPEEIFQPVKSQNNFFLQSDIFNFDNKISSIKTSEKYTVNKEHNKNRQFTVSSKSNSEWIAMTAQPSLLNHTSIKFHPLNPGIKNISKTKEEIITTTNFNPIHRQKMLCEYIDVTRVGCPNPLKEYRNIIKRNNNAFNRTSDMCSTYLDNFKNYKNLITEPFKN